MENLMFPLFLSQVKNMACCDVGILCEIKPQLFWIIEKMISVLKFIFNPLYFFIIFFLRFVIVSSGKLRSLKCDFKIIICETRHFHLHMDSTFAIIYLITCQVVSLLAFKLESNGIGKIPIAKSMFSMAALPE